jgi:receptor protein-tyrosine kinase
MSKRDDDLVDEFDETTVSPFELLRVVWRRRLLVGLFVVLCALVAVLFTVRSDKQYSASASLLFRDPGFARTLYGNDLFAAGQDPKRTAQTNVDVVASTNVAATARGLLHTQESPDSLLGSVTVTPTSDSDVAVVTAKRASPAEAASVANAFAEGYITYRKAADRQVVANAENLIRTSLQTAAPTERTGLANSLRQLDVLRTLQTGNAEVIAKAQPDPNPTSPRPKRNVLFGIIVGLLLGCGLALLVDYLDRRLQTTEDLERAYGDYPVMAVVPEFRGDDLSTEPSGPVGEAYRMLRESLRFLDPERDVRCIVITSADESEGKSTVARHLSLMFAAVGQEVVLLEADMRRPTAARKLGIGHDTPGLSDLLASRHPTTGFVQVPLEDHPTLEVLPAGTVPPNPADLLRTERMSSVLRDLRDSADMVIIDAPPLLPVADTRVLLQLPQVDGVIVVGRVGQTRRDRARETERVLAQAGRRVLGVVVMGAREVVSSSYYDDPVGGGSGSKRRMRSLLTARL